MNMPTLIMVTLEDAEYAAYSFGDTWNGFECPYFEKEVAHKIAADLGGVYNSVADLFSFEDQTFTGEPFDFNGEEVILYPIGSFCWTWTKVA